MNTKNNRRKRESIEKIERAFVGLLQEKGLAQISVSDICKISSLNRSTFYANYTDIYDLADTIREKLENSLGELYQAETTQGFNSNDYLKLFRHIRDNQIIYQTYFRLGYDGNYRIMNYDRHLAEQHFGNHFIEYHMEFFKSGLTKIIKMWLENGCQETPEEMFEIIKSEYRGREEFFAE
jgi:AcrR family transcriptional regulator